MESSVDQLLKYREQLVNNIVVNDGLFKALKDKKVITTRQESRIKRSGSHRAQLNQLLDLLPRLDRDVFKRFCEALKAANQEKIVLQYLQPSGQQERTNNEDMDYDEPDSAPVGNPTGIQRETLQASYKVSSSNLSSSLTSSPEVSVKSYVKPLGISSGASPFKNKSHESAQKFFLLASRLILQFSKGEQVVSQLVPKVIKDIRQSSSDFWDLFKRLNTRDKWPYLAISDGMTMLHQIVYHTRLDLLEVIFNLGIWENLVDVRAEGGPDQCHGLTAIEMAQKMNYTKVWKEIDQLSREEESMNDWHKAARAGDEAKIDQFLGQKPTPYVVNETSMHGKTLLFWAATSGKYSIMDKLVRAGADIFCRTEIGDTLMTRIISLNHAHLIRPLVHEWGLDPEQPGIHRKSPMYIAAENGNLETFKALLDAGVSVSGMALISASVSGKTPFLVTLLSEFQLSPDWKDITGKTPLLAAAAAGQIQSLHTLIEHKANINLVDKRKRNILHFAVESGCEATMKRVIEMCKEKGVLKPLLDARDLFSGAENIFLVKGKDQGRPAWHYVMVKRYVIHVFRERTQGGPIDVAHYGHVVKSGWGEVPSQGIASEVEQNYTPDKIGPHAPPDLTPLMLAIMKDQYAFVKLFLKEKPNLDAQDNFGLTALHQACMKGSINLVKDLVQSGCRTDVRDHEDQTPLQVAHRNGHAVVANFLEGRTHIKKVKEFVVKDLARAHRALDSRSLEEVQNQQRDVTRYSVGILRDLQADVSQLLYEMGTAPIGQATLETEEEQVPDTNTPTQVVITGGPSGSFRP